MKIRDIEEILKSCNGLLLNSNLVNENIEINSLLTDSRNYFKPEKSIFFAINNPGGNDGHKFIRSLFENGVKNFIVEKIPEDFLPVAQGVNFFVVTDTLQALSHIGRHNRHNAKEIIAITGSRGKTSLKEIIYQILAPSKKISRSPRSYNSKIGVPLSLWQIPSDTDLAIIEAGISQKGEMEPLASEIKPDTVIFTNIGEAHSHGFSSEQEKAREKSLLAFNEQTSTIIYPFDSILLKNELQVLEKTKKLITWSLSNPEADLFISGKEGRYQYVWENRAYPVEVKIANIFDLENVASALAFLLSKGYDEKFIEERLKNVDFINTRLDVSDGVNGCTVIYDSFTNDITSFLPVLNFMKRRKMPNQSPTLIMSSLQFDNEDPDNTYKEMASLVKSTGITKFIGIGEKIKEYSSYFPKESRFYDDTENFLKNLKLSDHNEEIILIKGSPSFGFHRIHERMEAKKHETVLEVNLDALIRNYNYFRTKIPSSTGIVAMVKASGYGAGSYEVAKTLQDAGAAYLAVAALDEGIELRKMGITMPIMIMNPKAANYRALFRNRLEPVVYSLPMLESLLFEASENGMGEYPVHIKLDTGMHRMGFQESQIDNLNYLLQHASDLKVSSIFSHLATADCLDMDSYTHLQLARFESMSEKIMKVLGYKVKRHILNSAGILRFPEYHYDLVRLGIGLYGANTLPPEIEEPLSPVSTLRSVIIDIREIQGDEAIGYGRHGRIERPTKVATIPVGYADGINRKFGNGAIKVMINGSLAPTIGNICMDASMIDVTGIECQEGDSVEIFGENINVQSLADTLGTIPYEILTSVSPRVKRVYYRE